MFPNKRLIEARSQVDLPDQAGETALAKAIRNSHRRSAELLLEAGAQLTIKGDIPDWILKLHPRLSSIALLEAAHRGDMKVVETELSKGVAVNRADTDGQTALILAVRASHIPIVEVRMRTTFSSILMEINVRFSFDSRPTQITSTLMDGRRSCMQRV